MTLCIPSAIGGEKDYDKVSGVLVVDGEEVAEVFSYAPNPKPHHWQKHQAATTAVVNCPTGGTVWVKCKDSSTKMNGYASQTVFTGYAITFHP